jgi:hypothetical protein
MDYIKVKDHNNLIRDPNSQAILNLDMNEYNNYMKLKKIKENESNRVKKLENDVGDIKNDLDDIKNLLRSLIDGSK